MEDLYENTNVNELKFKDFDLTEKNKYKILNKEYNNKNGIIIFYAPWCSHCQDMVNYWDNIAINFKNIYPICAVNTDDFKNKNNMLMSFFNIRHFPTIKEFNKENIISKNELNVSKDSLTNYIWSKVYSK